MQKIYVIFISFLFCIAVIGFKKSDIKLIIVVCGSLNIATLFIVTFNFRKRISNIVTQSANLNELNKKLTHTITRLRQSGEQWRKIIIEKDLEIFQLARHSSLAELTTGIAHELSQPLTGIKGIAQNMIDDVNFEEFDKMQGVSDLAKICHLVDKSSSIIDHIRNFSRKNVFSLKPIDLNQTILEALELIKTQLSRNKIDLVFVLEDSIPRIYGDKISLEQLILNMILNSKDAIKEKSGENINYQGVIRIATTLGDESVILKIEDNGIGIPGDIINKIWSPFFTTKDRGHGTGVGLSISNKIIKEHNAKVNINSDSGGTVFTIQFPIYDEKL